MITLTELPALVQDRACVGLTLRCRVLDEVDGIDRTRVV